MNEERPVLVSIRSRSVDSGILQDLRRIVRRLVDLLELTEPELNCQHSRSEALRKLLLDQPKEYR